MKRKIAFLLMLALMLALIYASQQVQASEVDVADGEAVINPLVQVFTYKADSFELNVTVPSYINTSTPDDKKSATLDIYLKKTEALSGFFSIDVEAGVMISFPIFAVYLFVDIDVTILGIWMPDVFRFKWPISGIPTETISLESGDVGVYALVVPVNVAEGELETLPTGEWSHIGSYDLYVVEEQKFVALGIPAENITIGEVASLEPVASGSSDSWVWVRDTITGAWGEAVVGTGDAIYIAKKSSFYRYRPVDNGWTVLAPPPNPDAGDAFKTGTALAWDFGDYIYALYGAATADSRRWFYCYSISGNSWQALANTPYDQGEGDAITWVDLDNCIYATMGGEQRATYFLRYDPSTNSWSDAPADPPAGMGDGASVVWTGDNFLYALRGEFYEESPLWDFWRYSLADDLWTAMADIPAEAHDGGVGGVGDGGSLLYIGLWLSNQTDYIYALSGNQAYPESPAPIPDNRFYRYTISTDNWECLADLPFGVGYYVGCRLGYADGQIYAWQGAPSTWTGEGDDLAYYEFPALAEIHDVTVVTVVPSTSEAYTGQIVNITVVVENEGDFTETFNVTAYASHEILEFIISIQTQTVTNLASASQTTLTFTWNTTAVTLGNYTISVEASVVPGEIDTGDNINIDGIVWMKSDSTAPDIGNPSQDPPEDNVQPNQAVTVSVNVIDLESGVREVILSYSTDEGVTWANVTMSRVNGDTYVGQIPGFPDGTPVHYKITAYDDAGNSVVNDNVGQYYVYTVIPEFPTWPLFLLTLILLGVVIILVKKRPWLKAGTT